MPVPSRPLEQPALDGARDPILDFGETQPARRGRIDNAQDKDERIEAATDVALD
jgi:hypothetical protein